MDLKIIKNTGLLLTLLLVFSCSCKKNMQKGGGEKLAEKIAFQLYGKSHKINYNNTKEFALVYHSQKTRKADIFPTIEYSIVDLNKEKIVYSDVVPGGRVKWIGDYDIEVKSLVGRPKDILNTKKMKPLYTLNVKTLVNTKPESN